MTPVNGGKDQRRDVREAVMEVPTGHGNLWHVDRKGND